MINIFCPLLNDMPTTSKFEIRFLLNAYQKPLKKNLKSGLVCGEKENEELFQQLAGNILYSFSRKSSMSAPRNVSYKN